MLLLLVIALQPCVPGDCADVILSCMLALYLESLCGIFNEKHGYIALDVLTCAHAGVFKQLSIVDRLLPVWIIGAMGLGILLGYFCAGSRARLQWSPDRLCLITNSYRVRSRDETQS